MTKMGSKRIHLVRGRGGNLKYRALRLESGNFSWGGEHVTKKTRILDVVYNASNNELVRTKTLVKSAVVMIDATPFRQWYETQFRLKVAKKTGDEGTGVKLEAINREGIRAETAKKIEGRVKDKGVDPKIEEQFATGRLLAVISSRPGQSGRCDGYVLEGPELEFYQKKLALKKTSKGK
jgi:small subunit ribosomal protein S8e